MKLCDHNALRDYVAISIEIQEFKNWLFDRTIFTREEKFKIFFIKIFYYILLSFHFVKIINFIKLQYFKKKQFNVVKLFESILKLLKINVLIK